MYIVNDIILLILETQRVRDCYFSVEICVSGEETSGLVRSFRNSPSRHLPNSLRNNFINRLTSRHSFWFSNVSSNISEREKYCQRQKLTKLFWWHYSQNLSFPLFCGIANFIVFGAVLFRVLGSPAAFLFLSLYSWQIVDNSSVIMFCFGVVVLTEFPVRKIPVPKSTQLNKFFLNLRCKIFGWIKCPFGEIFIYYS